MKGLFLIAVLVSLFISCGRLEIELPEAIQDKIDEAFVPTFLCNGCIDTMSIKMDSGNLVIIKNKDVTTIQVQK
jgi:hypothetical protein